MSDDKGLSRRQVLQGALGVGAAAVGVGVGSAPSASASTNGAASHARLPPRSEWRRPGSLPDPSLPEGTDTLPQIDHIVVVMQENHSFDNYLGMLGRGDGFTLDRHGRPTNTNPDPARRLRPCVPRDGHLARPATSPRPGTPATCNTRDGRNDGFIGPESSSDWSMAYYTGDEIPFYYSLAGTFPLCDRYFCSVLAQTYPNRRFLLAGTAFGLIATVDSSITGIPPNGTIFDRLDAHGISWASYATNVPFLYVISDVVKKNPSKDEDDRSVPRRREGRLAALPSPTSIRNILTATEENPQDLSLGEYFVSTVVDSLLQQPSLGPNLVRVDLRRARRLLRPCSAAARHPARRHSARPRPPPISRAPTTATASAFRRWSCLPTASEHFVSHTVYDHTSVLKTIERKWNLPAMTYRDANANDLLDCLDFTKRAFADPPTLAAPGNPSGISKAVPPPTGEQPPLSAFVKTPGVTV